MGHQVSACILLSVTIGLVGCATVESDWQEAKEKNTIYSYQKFLRKYPQTQYKVQAEHDLQELKWHMALQYNDVKHFVDFIEEYPDSGYSQEAVHMVRDIKWKKAIQDNTLSQYKEYINEYPESTHVEEANNKISALLANACSSGAIDMSVKAFKMNTSYKTGYPSDRLKKITPMIHKCGETHVINRITYQGNVTEGVVIVLGEYELRVTRYNGELIE